MDFSLASALLYALDTVAARVPMRAAFSSLVYLFLCICVLLGAWGLLFWQLENILWVELAVAAAVGLAAGALAPRETPAWLAWPVLVALAWAVYGYATAKMIPAPLALRFLVYPLAASVGVAAGLAAWRMPLRWYGWRLAPIALGAAAVVGLFFLAESLARWGEPGPWPAPAFTLQRLNGTSVSSSDLAGKTVVLAFWATWCAPCRKELPALQRLYTRHYAARKELRFFLVDEGLGPETPAKARAFLEHLNLRIPAAFDAGGKLAMKLKARGVLPVRIVIGPRGLVRLTDYGYAGDTGFPDLRQAIAAGVSAQ